MGSEPRFDVGLQRHDRPPQVGRKLMRSVLLLEQEELAIDQVIGWT
jgi:hypothetical protein